MSTDYSPAVLVARFLRSNNYHETLEAFLSEAGLPLDTASSSSENALTIEQILQEKKVFDVSLSFEKVNFDERDIAWTLPAPCVPTTVDTLPGASNILHVSVESVISRSETMGGDSNLLVASGANKAVNLLSPSPPFELEAGRVPASDSPVLSSAFLTSRYCVTSSMSGKLTLHDLSNGRVLDERRDHQKYIVKVACAAYETGHWVATAAWDSRVLVYNLPSLDDGEDGNHALELGEPVAEIKLQTNPESLLFLNHPEIAAPVLLVSRRDSTFLYYYSVPEIHGSSRANSAPVQLELLGRQNLAPHSNAWIAFTPSAFCISPLDPLMLAVATSAVPDMKLIIVRLLLPPPNVTLGTANNDAGNHATQAAQSRAALALEDREAAAILIHCSTAAPQTPYSTPALAWRPDATGVYVNGDDGLVRGVEARSGKVLAVLKDGHEAGTKIRCLWAGWADKERKDEIVVSGGFDRRLVVWRVQNETHR